MCEEISVSIVMPVYNAEEYLRETFVKILNQTFQNYEVFAVDDGSSDSSPQICDDYASLDHRIHVIHLPNQGSWNARNKGLEQASGKYLLFMDSDDWVEPDWLEQLVNASESNGADLVVAGFSMDYENGNEETTVYQKLLEPKVYSSQMEFRSSVYAFLNESVMSVPWNKLFLRERVMNENIRFKKKRMPDHFFCIDYLTNAQKVVLIEGGGYHWRRALASSNTQRDNKSIELFDVRIEHYQVMKRMYETWGMEDDRNAQVALATFISGRAAQCMQEIASNCDIPRGQRLALISGMINNPVVRDSARIAKPTSRALGLMIVPIKLRSPRLSRVMGQFVGNVRANNPKLFYRIKERAVHNV